jgi:hypothetical protein
MSKSENPDLLINIFTKERKSKQISLLVGAMVGDGWNPYMWGGQQTI